MNFLTKYKLLTINYNIISKCNSININELPNNLSYNNLLINNYMINSSYEFINISFILKFICKNKPFLLKNKKDNLFLGIKKNDSFASYITLRKDKLNLFYLKFITKYLKIIDIKRKYFYENKIQNILNINIYNINKIDTILLKEKWLNNYLLQYALKQKKNYFSKYKYSNNIKLLLSHLNFPFINN